MSVMVGAVLPVCSFNGMKSLGGVPSGVVDLLTATEAEKSIRSHDYGESSLSCRKFQKQQLESLTIRVGSIQLLFEAGEHLERESTPTLPDINEFLYPCLVREKKHT